MKRKWELIAEYCEENKRSESAALAHKIDSALDEMYEVKITKSMKQSYETIKMTISIGDLDDITAICGARNYCVACVEHNYCCEECIFGAEHGICMGQSGLFSEFEEAFRDGR